jgi:uncharacterized membrane protein YccC
LPDLPEELLDLIARHVDSMARAEVLLLLHRCADRAWRPEDAADALHVLVPATAQHLEALTASRLVRAEGEPRAYRYAPATPALHAAVEELRVAYDTRPVTLVRAIYERPSTAVRSFADAFRIRRPGD